MSFLCYGNLWAAPNWERQADCSLVSAPQVINDGYQETRVQLRLDNRALTVITESNIDFRPSTTGLSVDNGELLPAALGESDTRLLFTGNVSRIVDMFIAGNSAEVRLYFWPTWPETGQKTVRFSLTGFTRTYREQSCH